MGASPTVEPRTARIAPKRLAQPLRQVRCQAVPGEPRAFRAFDGAPIARGQRRDGKLGRDLRLQQTLPARCRALERIRKPVLGARVPGLQRDPSAQCRGANGQILHAVLDRTPLDLLCALGRGRQLSARLLELGAQELDFE